MANTKIIAVIVVIIVIVAGVAAYVVSSDDKPDDTPTETNLQLLDSNIEPVLEVYGNVNEDMVIDDWDLELLTQIVADGDASQYRYADANFDGTVDEKDIDYLQSIIGATFENPVTVKHLNRYNTGDYYTESKYPTNSVAISGTTNIIMMLQYADILDEIKALTYSGLIDATMFDDYQYLFSDYSSGTFDVNNEYKYRVGASAGYFSEELLANHIVNDGITAIFTADVATTYLAGASSSHAYGIDEKRAEELGLDVIRVASASTDPESYISDIALLCFFTGKDVDLQPMVDWYSEVISDINGKLTAHIGVDMDQMNFVVSTASTYSQASDGSVDTYNYISSGISDYTDSVTFAGGNFAMPDYDFGNSTASSKYEDLGQWLYDYDIDKIILMRTGSGFSWYGGTALDSGFDKLWSYVMAFSDSEPFYNNEVYVISGDMPLLLRTVYSACILYPELFTEEWADSYNVEHCTQFLGMDEETVRGGTYLVTMEDLGIQGH